MTEPTPGTDLAYIHSSLAERKEYAAALAAAGELVPSGFRDRNGAANPAKLLLAFETGAMLGLHPLAALQGIHVIEGKPTISAQLMSGLVRQKGHKLRVKSTGSIEGNDYTVTATLIRTDDPKAPFEATWTIDRARRAELFGKGNWRKYPEAMLEARAISEVCRKGAADALSGMVYTPEELGAAVDVDGDVIDGEIVDEAADSSPAPTVSNRPATNSVRQKPAEVNPDVYVDMAMHASTLGALRNVWKDANRAHALDADTSHGMTVGDAITARREALEEQAAGEQPPELDGVEEAL